MRYTTALGDERIVQLPQGPIRVFERGQGEPIVFVHGLFTNAALWRKVVPLLAGRYRCVTADWPLGSHSRAMEPDADLTPTGLADIVADTVAALDLHDVTLVGNDSGGGLSQLVVAHRPGRIGRLVLTPCDAYDNFPPSMFGYLAWLARVPGGFALLGQLMRVAGMGRLAARLPNVYGWLSRTRLEPALVDSYLTRPLRDPGVRRDVVKFLRSMSGRYTLDAAGKFPEFTGPVLVAWADDDRFFPFAHAERLAQDFPDARLERISGSRCYVPEDQPSHTATLIADFVAATPLTRYGSDSSAAR